MHGKRGEEPTPFAPPKDSGDCCNSCNTTIVRPREFFGHTGATRHASFLFMIHPFGYGGVAQNEHSDFRMNRDLVQKK